MITSLRALSLFGAAACAVAATMGAISGSSPFDLSWNTIDCGGGSISSGSFEVNGVIGQSDVDRSAVGGPFSVTGGFWYVPRIDLPAHCVADIAPTPRDGQVNVNDLLLVISQWGQGGGSADIAPPGGNGVVNVDDLLAVLGAWGDCP